VKYNPFHLLDWNATILPLLNENFGQLKRLLEKGHKASHEKGGVDEINVTGLSGELADPQKPKGHASDHEKGGSDEINVTGLKGVLADKQLSDWQVLAEVEAASDCDYVDFTGLDINRDWFYVLYFTVKNPTSDSSFLLYAEGDYTNANYYVQSLSADGNTVSVGRINAPYLGGTSAGEEAFFDIVVTRDPNGHFRYSARCNYLIGLNQRFIIRLGSKTAPVSNITSLRVSAEVSGAIGAGSKFILARPRS